jgi:hypothetical protein
MQRNGNTRNVGCSGAPIQHAQDRAPTTATVLRLLKLRFAGVDNLKAVF